MKKGIWAVIAVLAAAAVCILILFASRTSQTGNPPADHTSPAPARIPVIGLQPGHRYSEQVGLSSRRADLLRFLTGQLTGPYGVYTNRLETDQRGQAATGHEVLSESASLLLRFLAITGQQESFAGTWRQAQATFNRDKLFSYRYSPAQKRQYPLNAAVDDLRMIRSLYEAAQAFPGQGYQEEADRFAARFAATNIKDGYLYDFYDEAYGTTNSFITLCYIDLATLSRFPGEAAQRNLLTGHMLDIASNGYISNLFPFYQTRYNYESKQYETGSVHTVESMLTILSLAESGFQREESIRFIKERVAARTLYGSYRLDGTAENDIQSTAIYAIAAMIGSVIGDRDLYLSAIAAMNRFQITEPQSPLFGGFGDPVTGQAYSFDNLTALLAYSY